MNNEQIMKALDDVLSTSTGLLPDDIENLYNVRAAVAERIAERERYLLRIAALIHERHAAQNKADAAMRILTGIHALCAPVDTTSPDGTVRRFMPPDAGRYWHELSSRIRAIGHWIQTDFKLAHESQETTPP